MTNQTKKPKISLAEIEALKRKGLNQTQIAEMYGVTRSYISWVVRTYGGTLTPRQQAAENWPWDVPQPMSKASCYRRLREHMEYMVTGGRGMPEDQLSRLRGFYKKLRDENVVVEFDPNLPPEEGVSPTGGFAYRNRLPEDDDLLIRVNEFTNLTEQGRRIFRFPRREP